MSIDEKTKVRIMKNQKQFAQEVQKNLNLTEYHNLIDGFSKEQLLTEQQKLKSKTKLNFFVVSPTLPAYRVVETNIADDPEQKNRVWLRKNIAFVTTILQGIFKKIGVESQEFSGFMGHVKQTFLSSVSMPHFAEVVLDGKKVTLADKLSMSGMKAYRRFLLFLCDNLDHSCYVRGGNPDIDFQIATADALAKEMKVDSELNRQTFFTSHFLPTNIDACYKNMLKEKLVAEMLNQKFGLKRDNAQNEEIRPSLL